MLKLISIMFFLTAVLGFIGLAFGIFNDIGLAIISVVVVILGLFGWYVFKSMDSGIKQERSQKTEG